MLTTTKPRFFTTVVIASTWLLSSKMTTTTAFIVAGGRRSFITTASSTNQMGWKTPSNGIDTSTTTSFRSLVEQPRGQQHRHYSFFRKLFDGGDGFATKDDIEAALRSKKKATMLDVRTEKEISKDGKIVIPKTGWVNVPMSSPFDPCAPLAEKPQDILPDKEAPVILYCASGMRAKKVKTILQQQGYENVLNAGGANNLRDHGY